MIHWGISGNSHDASIAVFVDNTIVFASSSERFSGIKNDKHLCQGIVDYARKWGEPDRVFWYENPYKKTARQLIAGQGWKWPENNIPQYLRQWGVTAHVTYTDHHESHAAAGFFTSKYWDACIVVVDAIGEWETLTIWHGHGHNIKKIYSLRFPNSLGLWYSAMTQRCHLKPLEEEYILMGMAAYGDPARLRDSILNDFVSFPKVFGRPVAMKQNLHRGCASWRPDLTVNDTFDIAAATQSVYEEAFEKILQFARKMTKSDSLVLMGGCALNCAANSITGKYFSRTWIMPNPGDSGSAIGAALAHTKVHMDFTDNFMGYDMGIAAHNRDIVQYLLEHKMCGVARGKAEFGPRAFGNRSLLADPRDLTIKDKVNDIKQRQRFRPFAPAVLEEFAPRFFEMPEGWRTSPYMQITVQCKRPDLFPAIVHKDGTSRIQTVRNDGSPFSQLMDWWYYSTGCPILLNTSLNIRGKPMVNTKEDAESFASMYGIKVFT